MLISSCSNVKLEGELEQLAQLDPEATFCVIPPKELGKELSVLFVIDTSGSNTISGTDPNKARRIGAMTSFFNINKTNKYMNWGLEIFGGNVPNSAKHLIQTDKNQNFSNSTDFESALGDFQAVADGNATPYVSALNSARNAVENFINYKEELGQEPGNFHIIFISDGVPAPAESNTDEDIFSIVNALMKNTKSKIALSTVFYNIGGGDNANAVERLKKMSELGKGKFQDASNGEDIDLSEFVQAGLYREPYLIKDFFVYNLNSTLCDDGRMGADSDADGLCDIDEDSYNIKYKKQIESQYPNMSFSSTNRNSFDTRFSDLIIFKNLVDKDILPDCSSEMIGYNDDEDFDLLNTCEERYMYSESVSGPTTKWEDMMILNRNQSSPTNFDTDGDGVIDGLEFLFFKNKSVAVDFNSLKSRKNGLESYEYFRDHFSYLVPSSSPRYNLNVKWVHRNDEGQNCYQIDQEVMPIYKVNSLTSSNTGGRAYLEHAADENVVMIYYIMTTENNPNGLGVMRYSFQNFKFNDAKKINYGDKNFSEIEAKWSTVTPPALPAN